MPSVIKPGHACFTFEDLRELFHYIRTENDAEAYPLLEAELIG